MDKSLIVIREATIPSDFPDILKLWSSAGRGIHIGRSDSLEEIQKKQQRDPDLFLIAEINGKLVGTVLGGYDGRRGIVYHLSVSESYRKLGIGESLMAELETRLNKKGCIRCYLLVTKDNQESIEFYLNRGWEKMELFVMGKDIG